MQKEDRRQHSIIEVIKMNWPTIVVVGAFLIGFYNQVQTLSIDMKHGFKLMTVEFKAIQEAQKLRIENIEKDFTKHENQGHRK